MPPSSPSEVALIALAQAIGAHALEWFLAALALLLAASGLLAWSSGRTSQRGGGREAHRFARPTLGLVLGVALITAAGVVFAGIARAVGADGTLVRVDHAFLEALRGGASAQTVQTFGWITRLGDGLTLTLLCIVGTVTLWLRGERLLAIGLVVAMGGNGLLNAALKRVFERMRPLHEPGPAVAKGWSFPSGHSSGSLVAYGVLVYVLLRTLPRAWHVPVVMAATAIAFSVCCSRVFVEAHFASDVVAGLASGTAWLTACILGIEMARRNSR